MADLEPYTMEGFALCSFWRTKKLHCNFPNLREAVSSNQSNDNPLTIDCIHSVTGS